jgi:8-oxo-dGTP diphosphatase
MSESLWFNNPNGLIPRGTVCTTCARFNARDLTCNVIVYKDNQVLLIKRDHEPMKGAWGFPGGYLAWDETLAEAAARELFEETGLTAANLLLVGTRSDLSAGDGRQNVDIYFYTDTVTGEFTKQVGEVADIQWFHVNDLPQPLAFNHGVLLEKFLPQIIAQPAQPVALAL